MGSEYIEVCLEKGIYTLRIVHGKGIGVQREIVRSLLKSHPAVAGFRQEGGSGGRHDALEKHADLHISFAGFGLVCSPTRGVR